MIAPPRFLGLTSTPFGTFGTWGDDLGNAFVAELVSDNSHRNPSGGYTFRPVAETAFRALFPFARPEFTPVADLPEPITP